MIYVSLLRLKIGDTVDPPILKSPDSPPATGSEQAQVQDSISSSSRPSDVPAIVLSEVTDDKSLESDNQEESLDPVPETVKAPSYSSYGSSPTQSPPRKFSPEGTDQDTSDWNSQSSGSPMSSTHEKAFGNKSPDVPPEAESLIKATISRHVEEQIAPLNGEMSKSSSSRIPVRVREGEEQQRSSHSPGRGSPGGGDGQEKGVSRKITIKVQRPRSPNSIMAEARLRQEQERERKRREKEESERLRKEAERDEPVMTGSASEGGDVSEAGFRMRMDMDVDPIKSDDDDLAKEHSKSDARVAQMNGVNGDHNENVPVFVMPGQKHDMELLLEALRHARTEANTQDKIMQSIPADQPDFKQVVDKNIEQLEAQLQAVKAQSRELFEDRSLKSESNGYSSTEMPSRGRTLERDRQLPKRAERVSPPRGIRDVMVNQEVQQEETFPKEAMERSDPSSSRVTFERDQPSPQGILRYPRSRSPTDHARRIGGGDSSGRYRPGSRSPDKYRSASPYDAASNDEKDSDKRLIKFLTNEIENLKLKMAVVEQKNNQRARSPYGMGPRVSSGLPERDRSPGLISSRARARFPEFNSADGSFNYSPSRRCRSSEFLDETRSRSPRFDRSPSRVSRSPSRSPVSMYRSRTPERLSRDRTRPISPSARVLSLQDLSTSIADDLDGNTTFSPASGARPVSLGYSSPIRKVTQEIWGYDQTEDEYYADTAKYESWKQLISKDASSDEDMLELKQALASALVEIDILQAKVKNASDDIKKKMDKTTEVLNDCRAHLTKSQAENAELRAQNEREKAKSDAQELRIKEMEENMLNSKSNQDDKKLELEESVITLKGIVNLDKTQIDQLQEENEKLRKKVSDFQRENIKLKEDFNELKMYNDKAQTTIKDLKSCLEDARTERRQLIAEVKKMQSQGKTKTVSSIINHYMEKGLYEEAEKDHLEQRSRSRSVSPVRFGRDRSVSPVRPTSPVRLTGASYASSYTPGSRSQTPTNFGYSSSRPTTPVRSYTPRSQTPTFKDYNYEDISPAVSASDGHEIYPHRRTKSYIQKYGTNDIDDESHTPVDFNDPELKELLKPQPKLDYELDLNESYSPYPSKKEDAKRKLLYSPYMDKDYVPKSQVEVVEKEDVMKPVSKPTNTYRPPAQRRISMDEFENKMFMEALDTAVKETPAQMAQKKFLQDLDLVSTGPDTQRERWRSPAKGILKTAKSAQNMSIKESSAPRRSFESRSYSPSVRNAKQGMYTPASSRSYTPDTRSYSVSSSRSYTPTAQTRSYSPGNPRSRTQSPGNTGQRSYSPGNPCQTGYSPGDRYRSGPRDSGYSTPTQQPGRLRGSGSRTPQSSSTRQHSDMKTAGSPLLSDQERRYADLLIDKYTRQHLIGIPIASS